MRIMVLCFEFHLNEHVLVKEALEHMPYGSIPHFVRSAGTEMREAYAVCLFEHGELILHPGDSKSILWNDESSHLLQLRTNDYCAMAEDKTREFVDGTVTCGGNAQAFIHVR